MKKTIIAIVSLLVVLLIVVYGYEFIFKKPIIEAPSNEEQQESTEVVEIKAQHKGSTYIFAGSIDVPTPCHSLQTQAVKLSNTEYQIQINTIAPKDGMICAQVISQKSYKVTFDAPKDIVVTALINGVSYETNRFLIPSEENIDTFNLEIKG